MDSTFCHYENKLVGSKLLAQFQSSLYLATKVVVSSATGSYQLFLIVSKKKGKSQYCLGGFGGAFPYNKSE